MKNFLGDFLGGENPLEIKVWAQMFFDDGSVSQGVRISEKIYDDDGMIDTVAQKLLSSVNRDVGHLLIWGAGEIRFYKYPIFSSSA